MGGMWLYDNWGPRERKRDLRWRVGVAWAVFVIFAGTFIMGLVKYGSVRGIFDAYHSEGGSGSWSCRDNLLCANLEIHGDGMGWDGITREMLGVELNTNEFCCALNILELDRVSTTLRCVVCLAIMLKHSGGFVQIYPGRAFSRTL
jgi:hypothetical protein